MKIMVIDVAAEKGGAITVLNQFIQEFISDNCNTYDIILSLPHYNDSNNVFFHRIPWVKKSYIHRLYFDYIFVKRILKKYKPDVVFSLQNKTVAAGNIPQEVFYHNAIPIAEKKYQYKESKTVWLYQNIIGFFYRTSLKKAKRIYVQAEWIRQELIKRWHLKADIIFVKRPVLDNYFETTAIERIEETRFLFYPANGVVYKNHITLLKAFYDACKKELGFSEYSLVLTGNYENLSAECISFIKEKKLPVQFVGRLNKEQIREWYRKSVLVFPSVIETVGLPLIEAKASGCYILAADCMYAHETIGEYDKVDYFSPFAINELSERIIRTFNSLNK